MSHSEFLFLRWVVFLCDTTSVLNCMGPNFTRITFYLLLLFAVSLFRFVLCKLTGTLQTLCKVMAASRFSLSKAPRPHPGRYSRITPSPAPKPRIAHSPLWPPKLLPPFHPGMGTICSLSPPDMQLGEDSMQVRRKKIYQ